MTEHHILLALLIANLIISIANLHLALDARRYRRSL